GLREPCQAIPHFLAMPPANPTGDEFCLFGQRALTVPLGGQVDRELSPIDRPIFPHFPSGRPHAIYWKCIDASSPLPKPAAAYNGSIGGSWTPLNSSRTSQRGGQTNPATKHFRGPGVTQFMF